ncbi:serine/threonine-protein kinase [Rhodopirellula bahusiensis]|uniref:Serine/threonine protein kinase n=1 Tax=Rhodopirellula bahusiensis TaxID=2014065 RepID=A0A2G1WBM8_9BACT|nr:serine/threonine-protein kinase [Rhodopirellula bahusiensis]PHQ36448.1 serine/threonine protein kinase [Rhodopirellula bahusiensis]
MAEPEILGPYQIDSVIGRGGMGSVYRAHHAKSGEEVAVKLIAQHVADDMRFRRRFDAEIETLRRLRHPGIVRLIGYGEESGQLFYSMELVRGETLQKRIRDVKRLGWLPTLDIASQVCAALKHAHDIGVIHRDLKPANLILTDAGEVKLVDFGIAKLFGFGEQTLHGSVLGTADYMAPEQAGSYSITPRTDLYALGSVMYAMLAGRAPFAGKKVTQVVEALQRDRPVPLDLINPDIPAEVVEIVHQLLEKDPTDRPPTALAVLNRLKATRAGLQRGRTLNEQASRTQLGDEDFTPELPPNLAGDLDTRGHHHTDASREVSPDLPTNETGGDHITGRRVIGGEHPSNLADPLTDPAMTSTNDSATQSKNKEEAAKTHFQTIDSNQTPGGYLSDLHRAESLDSNWVQWASIAGMVLILLGGLSLFIYSIQTPSASTLFASLQEAELNGDLGSETSRMAQFLEAYPDDERAEQVLQWQRSAELESTYRQLKNRARSAGGSFKMPPAEQSLLQALTLRESSSVDAAKHLQAWLDVYSIEVDPEAAGYVLSPGDKLKHRLRLRELQQLETLVRDELERLKEEPSDLVANTQRELALRLRLTTALTLPPENKAKVLQGIVTLYEEQDWAAEIVTDAKQQLEATE